MIRAFGKASFLVTYETNLVLSAVRYVDTDGDGQGDLQEQAAYERMLQLELGR